MKTDRLETADTNMDFIHNFHPMFWFCSSFSPEKIHVLFCSVLFCSMFCRTEQYCSRTRVLCFFIPVHVPKLAKKENTKNIKKVNFEISVYFCIRTFLYLFPNFSRLKLSISHIPCSLASGGTWNVKHIEYPLPTAMGKDLSYLSKRSSIKLNG